MWFRLNERAFARTCGAIAAAVLLSWGTLAPAAADGLFSGMEGAWKGDGSIAWSTGETERMRCTAKYKVEKEGNRITQNLTCATDSTRLIIKSTITFNPDAGAITGDWSETSYGINGYVSGTASTGSVKALVKSTDNRFNARVTVVTRGSDQTVSIVPQGIDVTEVSVKLRRTG
jgi:predicted methyltransferase MtxX (methanogen marker protein 4)